MSERKFLLGMIASMVCWGFSWPVGKILSGYSTPENLTFLRFVVTFVSLFLLLVATKQTLTLPKKAIPLLITASVVMTLYGFLFLKGLSVGLAGAGGVLVTTLNPIFTFGLTMLLLQKIPKGKEFIGLLFGLLAGVILLKLWENFSDLTEAGNAYFVIATATWAVLSKITARSTQYGSPITFSLWMYGVCSLLMVFFVRVETLQELIVESDGRFWLNMFYSASITTAIATTFYFYATTKIGADKASSFIFMVPLSAALGAWLILNETPQWNTVLGGSIGMVAVYILNTKAPNFLVWRRSK